MKRGPNQERYPRPSIVRVTSCSGTGLYWLGHFLLGHHLFLVLPSYHHSNLRTIDRKHISVQQLQKMVPSREGNPGDRECDKIEGAFFVDYSRVDRVEDGTNWAWGLQACMPPNLTHSPCNSTCNSSINDSSFYKITLDTTRAWHPADTHRVKSTSLQKLQNKANIVHKNDSMHLFYKYGIKEARANATSRQVKSSRA